MKGMLELKPLYENSIIFLPPEVNNMTPNKIDEITYWADICEICISKQPMNEE